MKKKKHERYFINIETVELIMSVFAFLPLSLKLREIPVKSDILPASSLPYITSIMFMCLHHLLKIRMASFTVTYFTDAVPSEGYKDGIFILKSRRVKFYFYKISWLYVITAFFICLSIYSLSYVILKDMIRIMGYKGLKNLIFFPFFSLNINIFILTFTCILNRIWDKNDDLRTAKDINKLSPESIRHFNMIMSQYSDDAYLYVMSHIKDICETPVRLDRKTVINAGNNTVTLNPGEYILKTDFKYHDVFNNSDEEISEDEYDNSMELKDIMETFSLIENKKGPVFWYRLKAHHYLGPYEIDEDILSLTDYKYGPERMFSAYLNKYDKLYMFLWEYYSGV